MKAMWSKSSTIHWPKKLGITFLMIDVNHDVYDKDNIVSLVVLENSYSYLFMSADPTTGTSKLRHTL